MEIELLPVSKSKHALLTCLAGIVGLQSHNDANNSEDVSAAAPVSLACLYHAELFPQSPANELKPRLP